MEVVRIVEPPPRARLGLRSQWRRAADECWRAGQMIVAFLAAALVFGPPDLTPAHLFRPAVDATRADPLAIDARPAGMTRDTSGPPVAVTVELRAEAPEGDAAGAPRR